MSKYINELVTIQKNFFPFPSFSNALLELQLLRVWWSLSKQIIPVVKAHMKIPINGVQLMQSDSKLVL